MSLHWNGVWMDHEMRNVSQMHEKFGLTLNTMPTVLPQETMLDRYRFLQEETYELLDAIYASDFPGMIDALVDLVVVAKGTAVMMGIPWDLHWEEVHSANMAKVRGIGKRGMKEDLIKPEGWEPPDHQSVLDSIS